MNDLFMAPAVPFYTMGFGGALMALLGLVLMGGRSAVAGPGAAPLWLGTTGRLIVGQTAGVITAALLLAVMVTGGARGTTQVLLMGGAVATYLAFGVALPRLPQQRREREAASLRRLTPGFVSFVRVALGSFESPLEIMRRYTRRAYPRLAPMQHLVAEALQTGADLRLRPFAALALVARARGCRELTDVADALAQAEAEGGRAETVLAAHQETLEQILQGEFKRRIRRRTLYLLLMVAISLVVGILINLLFVMTGGGTALGRLG